MRYKVCQTKKTADTAIRGSKCTNCRFLLTFVYDMCSLNFSNNKGPYAFIVVIIIIIIIIIVIATIIIIVVYVQV